MKSWKEIGPWWRIRSARRSESDKGPSIIFSPMRSRVSRSPLGRGGEGEVLRQSSQSIRVVLAISVSLSLACASHREPPLPTLEDYFYSVTAFTEKYLEDWKAGPGDPGFYAEKFAWSGPLPGEDLLEVPTRPPLRIALYRRTLAKARPSPRPPPAGRGSEGLRRRLAEIRDRFASLGRTEQVIFDFHRRGDRREIALGLFLSGNGKQGELRQEGGKLRAVLKPSRRAELGWEIESASVLDWLEASASEPLFEEVAEKAGLSRAHKAFLPNAARNVPIPGEHMPPGIAVLDFDGDGREDLFIPGGDGNRLYRNRGDGTYEDVATKAGVAGQEGEAIGALAFDYDLDGLPDLYVLVYGPPDRGPNIQADNAPPNHLFHNNGDGTFTDVSKRSRTDDTGWGLALESADLDGDGWPDLYIANDFGNNTYLHNNGDGTFTNIAGKAGVKDPGFGMGVAVDDSDGDGRLDFYVSNYSFPYNWFLRDPRYPMPEFPYSLGRPLVWRRLKALSRGSSLFRPDKRGGFERVSDEAGVWDTSWSWGAVFVDADMDGRPDIFVVNGMVTGKNPKEHEIDFWNLMSAEYKKFEKGIPTGDFGEDSLWGRVPKRFYKNLDGRHFAELAAVTGLESDANQRGLVVTDSNGDGAPDLFATGFLQRPSLWINRNPSRAKSLVVTLQGDPGASDGYRSTRDALGAIVTVEAGGVGRTQVVSAGYSFLSSGSKSLFFGLGDRVRADHVTVLWPSGKMTQRQNVPAGRLLLSELQRSAR